MRIENLLHWKTTQIVEGKAVFWIPRKNKKCLDLYLQTVLSSLHLQYQKTLIEFSFSTPHPWLHLHNFISQSLSLKSPWLHLSGFALLVTSSHCVFSCSWILHCQEFSHLNGLSFFQTIETENEQKSIAVLICMELWLQAGVGLVLSKAAQLGESPASDLPQEGLHGHMYTTASSSAKEQFKHQNLIIHTAK